MQDELGPAIRTESVRRIIIREFDGITDVIDDNNYEISIKDLEKYEGKWIAILNGKIVCGEATPKEAFDRFKKLYKKETPLLDRIPDRTEANTLFY